MRKLKLLLAACALFGVGAGSANAQTDVTATYLTNADFETDEALTGDYLYGYGKDGTPYGLQPITGWTSVVTSGDNSNNSYPNSGMAGGVFSYGSSTQLKGNAKAAPATNPNGEATGKCFGFFGVWGCGGYYYQTVTLAPGAYTITVPMYNQSGTQANTTYTGFFPTSGTNRTVAVNPTVGSWQNQTVSFTLDAETEGQIRIGYQSSGNGSGANPHIFIDCVKIEYTAIVVKDVLETAIAAATKANTALGGTLDSPIATAQVVYDNADATQDEVNAAATTLNNAVNQAMATVSNIDVTDLFLTNANLSSTDGWTVDQSSSFRDQDKGLIGTYNVRFSAATVDDTHLDTEYCFGFEARWATNYASYNQTTEALPAGVYTLTYDVENVNGATTSASYEDYNFVQVGETKNYSSTTEWMSAQSSWTTHTIRVTLNDAAPLTVSFGYGTGSNNLSADVTPAIYVSHVKLNYSGFLAGAKAAWDEAKAAAEAAIANTDYANVTGFEKTALQDEIDKAEPTTVDGYNEATDALNNATAAFTAAKVNYDALVAEIAYSKTIGVTTADDFAATSESTAASVVTNTQNLKVEEYTTINTAYPNDVTSLLGTWEKGDYDTTSGQGYTGDETYFDKWSGSATDLTSSATVTLPAGKYAIKVAGRGDSNTTMNLSVKVGDSDAVSTPFLMNGDSGKGIDTEGATNFEESGTYSNNNNGRGWQYRYITFETEGEDVTVTISGHLNNSTWQSFYAPVLLCDEDTYAATQLIAAKAELQVAIDNAPAVLTVNIGTGAFQMPETGVNAYSEAKTTAQAAHDAGDATLESIAAAKEAFESAIETYNALEINAPADDQLFNVILTYGGWTYDQKAMTYMAGDRDNQGGYNIKYNAPANKNLAQAFTFTKVSGNNYKMSQIDADGNVRYMCTAKVYDEKGSTSSIRTTTNADDAMLITVIPTATEGVWNLKNVTADNFVGSQDAGVFTVNSHIDFNIVETTKPSIAINTTAAGYGTTMLPFAVASLPDGVKAYTCEEVDGTTLTLVEVTALEANKPYIIEGAWETNLTGYAQGTALGYTEGLLTGVYAETDAPVGSYVLQNLDSGLGFYQVAEDKQPKVGANHAYLTLSEQTEARVLFFDNATAIRDIEALTSGEAEIYNAAGIRQNGLQKGVNIIKQGNKKFKVMVK